MKITEREAERATGLAMQEINSRLSVARDKISHLKGSARPSDVARVMQPVFQLTNEIAENQIASVYLESYYRECYEVQDRIGYYWKPRKMTASNVRVFLNNKIEGKNWRDRLQGHYRDYTYTISDIKNLGVINNIAPEEVEQMISRETGTIGECGLTYKIMRILRTESNNAVNRGAVAAYKQCGVPLYKVIAILDDRTCLFCWIERHERVYPVSQAKQGDTLPPFHPNCRCYTEPVGYPQKMKKNGRTGKLTYSQWRKIYVD